MPRVLRRWGVWALIVVAAVAALALGAQRSSHPTLDQRTRSLASQVRCPVCGGESAEQSQVPAALAIRNQIHDELAAGTPPARVLDDLVAAYGTGILEKPPATGVGLLVWVLPIAAVVVAGAGLVLAFTRWQQRPGASTRAPAARPEDEALVARALAGEGPRPDAGAGPDGEGTGR